MTYFQLDGPPVLQERRSAVRQRLRATARAPADRPAPARTIRATRARCTGPQTQNSRRSRSRRLFGAGTGTPPTVTITNPTSAHGPARLPGQRRARPTTAGVVAQVELRDRRHDRRHARRPARTRSTRRRRSPRHAHVEAIAYDSSGHARYGRRSTSSSVRRARSTTDCPNHRRRCVGGRCVRRPGRHRRPRHGVHRGDRLCVEACARATARMYCVEPCTRSAAAPRISAASMPATAMTGVCWPGYDDGSGGCGCRLESHRVAHCLFGLLFAVTVFTWRRAVLQLS